MTGPIDFSTTAGRQLFKAATQPVPATAFNCTKEHLQTFIADVKSRAATATVRT